MSDTAAPAVSQETKPKQAKKNHLSGGFFRFVLTRFLLIIPTVFILVTVVFFVMRATGDPISAALGGRLAPDELQKRIHAAGYDRPLIVQYIDYLGGLLHGDLGTTLTDNQPVISILVHYGSATFELALLSLIVALIVGIGLGRVAACRRDHAADAGIRTFAILCYATPVFFLGLVLKLIFAIWLNVLPASGRCSLSSEMQFTRLVSPTGFYIIDALQLGDMSVLADVLRHAVLPALALGLLTAGVFIRLVRTNCDFHLQFRLCRGCAFAWRRRKTSAQQARMEAGAYSNHHRYGHADRIDARRRGAYRNHLRMEGTRIHVVPISEGA